MTVVIHCRSGERVQISGVYEHEGGGYWLQGEGPGCTRCLLKAGEFAPRIDGNAVEWVLGEITYDGQWPSSVSR